jgi:hypothetical protein
MPRTVESAASEVNDKFLRQRILAEAGLDESAFDVSLTRGNYLVALLILGAGAGCAYYILKR